MVDRKFWKDKKVFITGHTGFKGSWLCLMLQELGADIKGLSLPLSDDNKLFRLLNLDKSIRSNYGDIRNFKFLESEISNFSPEVVFHLAAQPLVRESYESPIYTFETNIIGTANLLEASKNLESLKCLINITSDKCYQNLETGRNFIESDPMGGNDPYSCSKGCAELITHSYQKSFFEKKDISLCSVRAGNVIGGGDYSADRLVPDILNAINLDKNISLRNPKAIRPWQHVIEPLFGYLILAQQAYFDKNLTGGWNFGPTEASFKSVEWIANKFLEKKYNSKTNLNFIEDKEMPESQVLKLDVSKAIDNLGWKPKLDVNDAIDLIIDWNDANIDNKNMYEISTFQLKNYYNL
jgi:CDP-glucose 4,6-dehydratase